MNIDLFNRIYDDEVMPFIREINNNNSMIKIIKKHPCSDILYQSKDAF